jgi:hypothetical protein
MRSLHQLISYLLLKGDYVSKIQNKILINAGQAIGSAAQ